MPVHGWCRLWNQRAAIRWAGDRVMRLRLTVLPVLVSFLSLLRPPDSLRLPQAAAPLIAIEIMPMGAQTIDEGDVHQFRGPCSAATQPTTASPDAGQHRRRLRGHPGNRLRHVDESHQDERDLYCARWALSASITVTLTATSVAHGGQFDHRASRDDHRRLAATVHHNVSAQRCKRDSDIQPDRSR